jgi:hypothetical protein
MAAITAAETNPHSGVILLEKSHQLLAKVKISGGGRCNVTNAITDPAQLVQYYPRGGSALRGPFTRFGSKETVAWFEKRGVRLKTEPDGRMFPVTDQAQTIINCLIDSAKRARVEIRTGIKIESLEKKESGFVINVANGEPVRAEKMLIASGSDRQGYEWAGRLGHTLESPVPSLFTFNIKDKRLEGLAGIAVEPTELHLGQFHQAGPTLITHWGLSGPAVLKLSAWAARELFASNYRAELVVNWLPKFSEDRLREVFRKAKEEHPRRLVASQSPVPLPQRLWERLTAGAEIETASQRWTDLSKSQAAGLIQSLINSRFKISGKGVFKEEFVTCGGVTLKEINFKTMESRVCAGLYLAGEVLDIDGVTGGFNFQSAWTTGWLAGQAMAQD